jgi:hypothetical protein
LTKGIANLAAFDLPSIVSKSSTFLILDKKNLEKEILLSRSLRKASLPFSLI